MNLFKWIVGFVFIAAQLVLAYWINYTNSLILCSLFFVAFTLLSKIISKVKRSLYELSLCILPFVFLLHIKRIDTVLLLFSFGGVAVSSLLSEFIFTHYIKKIGCVWSLFCSSLLAVIVDATVMLYWEVRNFSMVKALAIFSKAIFYKSCFLGVFVLLLSISRIVACVEERRSLVGYLDKYLYHRY